jgi:phosphoglycerate kinase
LKHILKTTSAVLGVQVKFVSDCIGQEAENAAAALKSGEVLLLENLRFHSEEEAGGVAFAEQLASLGNIYVNDAFGTAHRAHASTTIIAHFLKAKKCWILLAKEIESLNKVLKTVKTGNSSSWWIKVSSKITVIENILDKVDHMIIGGMTFTL